MAMARSGIGDRLKRREDFRFVTGRGAYLDDLPLESLTHAIVLRSPHAHARLDVIDTKTARAMPGVLAVLTAGDARADGLQSLGRQRKLIYRPARNSPSDRSLCWL